MYNLTFFVTAPIFLISAVLFFIAMMRLSQRSPSARNMMSLGFGVWIIGVVVGSIVFLFG